MLTEVHVQSPHIGMQELTRRLLRPEEAAEVMGISRARLYELLAAQQVMSIKIGRSRRIPVSEIDRWIASEVERQCSGTRFESGLAGSGPVQQK